jgi:hypothetical protein
MGLFPLYLPYLVEDLSQLSLCNVHTFYRGIPCFVIEIDGFFQFREIAGLRKNVAHKNKIVIPFPKNFNDKAIKVFFERRQLISKIETQVAVLNQFKQKYMAIVIVSNTKPLVRVEHTVYIFTLCLVD